MVNIWYIVCTFFLLHVTCHLPLRYWGIYIDVAFFNSVADSPEHKATSLADISAVRKCCFIWIFSTMCSLVWLLIVHISQYWPRGWLEECLRYDLLGVE